MILNNICSLFRNQLLHTARQTSECHLLVAIRWPAQSGAGWEPQCHPRGQYSVSPNVNHWLLCSMKNDAAGALARPCYRRSKGRPSTLDDRYG